MASNIYNGKLLLDDKILSLLRQKHLASIKLNEEVVLQGEKPSVHSAVFEDIYLSMVKEAALKTKSGSGPSGLDADGWRKMENNSDLRRAFALSLKKDTLKSSLLTKLKLKLMACRLIHLVKNPGLQPIEVGEVLQRIAGKVIMKVVKEDIKKVARYLQLRAHQEVGSEAAIHAMHRIFESNKKGRY